MVSPAIRQRAAYLLATSAVIGLGLAVRHPGMGLPWPVAKYGGSLLWGAMVYCLAGAAVPEQALRWRAAAAALSAVAVECLRLYHAPWLDAFRATPAGALLLGRVFSPWNVAAYWAGIGLAAALSAIWLRRARLRRGGAASQGRP
jgi:hypothetical protein